MKSSASRVQKHRANMQHKGLKLVQIWVPDVKSKVFLEESKRQSILAKNSEDEVDTNHVIASSADLSDWE